MLHDGNVDSLRSAALRPVIAMTKASQVFGLKPDAVGVWSRRELSDALSGKGGQNRAHIAAAWATARAIFATW